MASPTDDANHDWFAKVPPGGEYIEAPAPDPLVRLEYEAALGRFLLAFNQIECEVSCLIREMLKHLGKENQIKAKLDKNFKNRLNTLKTLFASVPSAPHPNHATIGRLSELRNKLAHSHFDQHPAGAEYDLVGRLLESEGDFSPESIRDLASEADRAYDELRICKAFFFFRPIS